jgi:hypothetical protein
MYEGQSEQKSKIRNTEDSLYSRQQEEEHLVSSLRKKNYDVANTWDEPHENITKIEDMRIKKRREMIKNILIVAVLFFVAAGSFAFYTFYGNKNEFSSKNVNISIEGDVSVDAGKPVEMKVLVENKNITNLEAAELIIDLPEGARATFEGKETTLRVTKSLGTILPNQVIEQKISVMFFGEEKKTISVRARVEYHFTGSSAISKNEYEHSILIVSSQVSLSLKVLNEVSSGQEIEILVLATPSTSETLEGLMVKMNYPFGFTFKSATPAPTDPKNTTWVLEPLKPFTPQEIRIRGVIEGVDDSSKAFAAKLGLQNKNNPDQIETLYGSVEESTIIKKPFIGLTVNINDKPAATPVVIEGNKTVVVTIPWSNNTTDTLMNMVVEAKIDHPIANRLSIKTLDNKGFFRSVDDTIVWEQRTDPDLGKVLPGASGIVSFSFELNSIVGKDGRLYKDPEIGISATANARRLSDVLVPEALKTPAVGKARLQTSIDLVSKIFYRTDPSFVNTGPIPPKANMETTYTIKWQINNGTSNVSNAVVRAKLPPYASWKGAISPKKESIYYDVNSGEIKWNAGAVPAGAGIPAGRGVVSAPREVSFQIGIIPSTSHISMSPEVITQTTLTAIDSFTNTNVSSVKPALTTNSISEKGFDLVKDGKVSW